MSQTNSFAQQRRFDRYDVNLYGEVDLPNGSTTVRVVDLSYGGARIEFPLPFSGYGASFQSLRLPGIAKLDCTKKWSHDYTAGLAFKNIETARKSLHPYFIREGLIQIRGLTG